MHQFRDEKETGPEMSAAIVSGVVTGERQSVIGQFFPFPYSNSQRSLSEGYLAVGKILALHSGTA